MQRTSSVLDWSVSITSEQMWRWTEHIWCLKRPSSSLLLQDQLTLETILISSLQLTIGLMKIEYTMNTKLIFEGPRFMCSMQQSMQGSSILPGSTPSDLLAGSMGGLAMTEIPIWRLIYPSYPQEKSCRLSGTEPLCLFEDWLHKKYTKKITNTQPKLFLIRERKLCSALQAIPRY